MKEFNAKIIEAEIELEDHGLLIWHLTLEWDYVQGFGMQMMDTFDKKEKRRVGHKWGSECLLRIMEVLGVEKWSQVQGKYVRGRQNEEGELVAIGHIVEDRWFNPKERWKEFVKEDEKV
jgi:hypothetical protein